MCNKRPKPTCKFCDDVVSTWGPYLYDFCWGQLQLLNLMTHSWVISVRRQRRRAGKRACALATKPCKWIQVTLQVWWRRKKSKKDHVQISFQQQHRLSLKSALAENFPEDFSVFPQCHTSGDKNAVHPGSTGGEKKKSNGISYLWTHG